MEKKDWRTKIGSILNNNRVDILDKDGSELLNDLEELFNQELDKAREEGCADGLELEQLLNAEFFEEDYQNPKRLKELMKRYKLKTKEDGK